MKNMQTRGARWFPLGSARYEQHMSTFWSCGQILGKNTVATVKISASLFAIFF